MLRLFLCLIVAVSLYALDNKTNIKNYITDAYKKQYKDYNINISDISLNIPQHIKLDSCILNSIDLNQKALSKSNGIVILNLTCQNTALRVIAEYFLHASIVVYKATSAIKKFENITSANTSSNKVSLNNAIRMPITSSNINTLSAKSYIPANSIITLDKTQEKILIRKNDTFIGVIQNGSITIETTLIAKENGAKNQIINALNPDTKKIIRIKVINADKGEIL